MLFLINEQWPTFGRDGVAFCSLEVPNTLFFGNKWLSLNAWPGQAVTAQKCLYLCRSVPAPSHRDLPQPYSSPRAQHGEEEKQFWGDYSSANYAHSWVAQILLKVSTNSTIMLQAINFPSSTHRFHSQAISISLMLPWLFLSFSF